MSTKLIVASGIMMAATCILLAVPAIADNFEYLSTIPSAHGLYYSFMTQKDDFIALGDGSESRNGVEIIDAHDPTRMVSVGYDTASHMTYSLDWDGNFVYIPGSWDGLFIYDVTNLGNIILASHISRPGNYPILGIAVRNNLAYVGSDYGPSEGGGLYCLAVDDPYNPSLLWRSDTVGCQEIFLRQSLLYSYSWCQDIKIFDISEPTEPRGITQLSCPLIDAMDIDESRHLMYVTCFNTGLKIYDISDPLSPELLSTTSMPNGAQCIDVCHSKAYHQIVFVSGYTGGLWALNTSDPSHPVATASYFPSNGQSNFVMARDDLVFLTSLYSLTALRYNYEVGVDGADTDLPSEFSLIQNYPNPFNAGTHISFILSENQNIKLEIYDAIGRKIQTLFHGFQAGGYNSFQWDASEYPSGSYFYGLTVGNRSQYRKMTLLK